MKCSKCACEAVITQKYSGMSLCPLHFTKDFESRAKKAIRKHRWLSPNDCIAVEYDGSYAAAALIHLLVKFFGKRPDIRLILTGDDEDALKKVSERYDITYALRSAFVPGDFGCTKMAIAATLDSEAEFVFECILKGDSDLLFSRGRSENLPQIMPIMNIPADEAELYCRIHDIKISAGGKTVNRENPKENSESAKLDKSSHNTTEFSSFAKELLDGYNEKHPASKYALVNLMAEIQNADKTDKS